MWKIRSCYIAAIASITCIVCLGLILFTDIATISVMGSTRDFSMMDLLSNSVFDTYPYSVVDHNWRILPAIMTVLLFCALICSFFYKKKAAIIIGVILALIILIMGFIFNKMQMYDIGGADTKWIMTYGTMIYNGLIILYAPSLSWAKQLYDKENEVLRP